MPNQANGRLRYNLLSTIGKDICAKFDSLIPSSGLVLVPFLIRTVLRKLDFFFVVPLLRKKIIMRVLSLLSLRRILAIALCTLHTTVYT